jgi:hypothetical protein
MATYQLCSGSATQCMLQRRPAMGAGYLGSSEYRLPNYQTTQLTQAEPNKKTLTHTQGAKQAFRIHFYIDRRKKRPASLKQS